MKRSAWILILMVMAAVPAMAGENSEAQFTIAPYLWMPAIEGDVGMGGTPVGDLTVPVDVAFLDYADNLNMALLLLSEVRKGRWALAVDGIYMRLGDDAATPGAFLSTVDVEMDTFFFSIAPVYRFVETERFAADVLLGARYVYMEQNMDLSPDFGAVDSISEQVVATTADKLSAGVSKAVDQAKDDISGPVSRLPFLAPAQVEEAIDGIDINIKASVVAEEILGQGVAYEGGSLLPQEAQFAEAVQDAVAERAADLVRELSPSERQDPAKVEAAIAKAASEPLDQLKNNVSAATRKALDAAETALGAKVEDGMTKAADADAEADRDWVDPFVGLRLRFGLTDRLALLAYGDIGGFGVGSDLIWQAFGGLGWQATESVSIDVGYRHLDIDYDKDHFIVDMAMSGLVAGCRIRF